MFGILTRADLYMIFFFISCSVDLMVNRIVPAEVFIPSDVIFHFLERYYFFLSALGLRRKSKLDDLVHSLACHKQSISKKMKSTIMGALSNLRISNAIFLLNKKLHSCYPDKSLYDTHAYLFSL